jgi:hypothetical protein
MRLIVCDALGLDSGEYSFPYVTRWAADGSTEVVRETAERAIGCAKEILVALEDLGRGEGSLATVVGAGTARPRGGPTQPLRLALD